MTERQIIQHLRTNELNVKPNSSDIEYGEIAINYRKDNERLFVKNDNNEIVEFTNKKYVDNAINGKQDKISDLETIRSNASKGATALQSIPAEYVTETELQNKGFLTAVPSEYITATELQNKGYLTSSSIEGLASEEYVNAKFDEVFQNVSNGKILIAGAITDKGVYASDEETFQELSEKIGLIPVGPPGSKIIGYVDDENDIYISLTEVENGTYTLKFEDFNGILSNYDLIGEIEINDSSDNFKALLDCNIAPQEASKIGIYDVNGNMVGTIPLFNYKKKQGEKLYSFGLISDLHIQVEGDYDSHNDLRRAFNYFTEQGINMTCCCGDIVDTNVLQEYINFKTIKDQYPDISFYSCTGNHDCIGANGYNKEYWKTYIGTEKTFELNHNGDHFLFVGMNVWDFKNGYTDQDLDWLETKLNEYRNERCFVFMHCPITQYVGNYKEMYTSDNWLNGSNLYRVTEMVNYYKNSIWFSGHSHWKWHLQKWEENANIYRNNTAWNVHIPSCAIPGDAIDDVELGRMVGENEGGIVDVYENYVEIKGIDFKTGKYIPVAQYRLDTTIQSIIDKDNSALINLRYANATADNTLGVIEKGQSYTNTFIADEGYIIDEITVKMGNEDITSLVLTNGVIYIPNVTGDIEIIVTVKQLNYLMSGRLMASDFALYSTDNGQTVTQDGDDIVFYFPTATSSKFTWVAGNAVGNKYSQSTHIAVLEYDDIEYSQDLSDIAKCYVGFIDLSMVALHH